MGLISVSEQLFTCPSLKEEGVGGQLLRLSYHPPEKSKSSIELFVQITVPVHVFCLLQAVVN